MLLLQIVTRRRLAGSKPLVAFLQFGDHLRRRELVASRLGQGAAALRRELPRGGRRSAHHAGGDRGHKESATIRACHLPVLRTTRVLRLIGAEYFLSHTNRERRCVGTCVA